MKKISGENQLKESAGETGQGLESIPKVPAPWNLKGRGYIILFRLKKDFAEKHTSISPSIGNFAGGFGAVMLVDYQESDAGPYQELLSIPAKYMHQGKKRASIDTIYVSTMESVVNGRRNWGIPKQYAEFSFSASQNGKTEDISVQKEGENIFSAGFMHAGMPFPVHTRFLPFPLIQEHEGSFLYTRFSGKGIGRLAKISEVKTGKGFLPMEYVKPTAVIYVDPFSIIFPQAVRVQ
ncbi:MAG: acetoacetate decarboxylase family protein [Spirochaetia bacterium]|nr:acetoacetate decarboxylase family protein [Spirochaetia bacterium]